MEMRKITLGDCIIDCASGPFGSNLKVECFVEDGFPIIDGANLKGVRVTDNITKFVTEEKARSLSRSIAKRRDVIVTISGTLGQISFIPNDSKYNEYLCSQRQFRVTFDESKIDVEYLVNYLHTDFGQKKILSFANYVGVPALAQPLPNFKKIELLIPSIQNQKKVVQVLSALDDKIALNKKMNQKLEAMAKRLYDYWFVQFDFPDKNGHPYKTTGGPMTYNPTLKREIPEGWEVVDINELCQVVDCLHSKKPDFCYEDENSYLLALENITKEGYIDLSDKYYISKKDFAEWTSRICVRENDFLFTNAGRAGDMGMVPEGVLCAIGRNITAVRPEKINPWYLRCFFKSLYMQEQILNNLDQGSFFMSFNVRSIKKLQVLMPSEPLMKKFISFVEPHLKRIEKNNKEISRLTKLRDKLLPLLMNGQVEDG